MLTRSYAVVPLVPLGPAATPGAAAWPPGDSRLLWGPAGGAPAEHWSVADYWAQETDGEVRVGFDHQPAVGVDATDADWVPFQTVTVPPGSDPALARLVARVVAPAVLASTNGVVLVSHQVHAARAFCRPIDVAFAGVDGKASTRTLPITYVTAETKHRTLVHEVGHMLGLQHPFGIASTADVVMSPMYGSPPCIMGTAGRWDEVSFDRTPAPVGSAIPPSVWRGGPGCAMATLALWRQAPDGWGDLARHVAMPWLHERAWSDAADGFDVGDRSSTAPHAVLVGHWSTGGIVIEVRRPRATATPDWDAALRLDVEGLSVLEDDVFDAPGIVVHRFEDIPGVGVRVVYAGTIPLPLGPVVDVALPGPDRRRVRCTAWNAATGIGHITISSPFEPARPWASISSIVVETVEQARPSRTGFGELGPLERSRLDSLYEVALTGPTCGRSRFVGRTIDEAVRVQATAHAHGLDAPGLDDRLSTHWSIAGVPLPSSHVVGQVASTWTVSPTLEVRVPDGWNSWTSDRRQVTLRVEYDWQRCTISVPAGVGEVHVPIGVVATVSGGALAGPISVEASAHLVVTTKRLRFSDRVAEARRVCTDAIWKGLIEHREVLEGVVVDPGPIRGPRRFALEEVEQLASRLRDVAPELLAGGGPLGGSAGGVGGLGERGPVVGGRGEADPTAVRRRLGHKDRGGPR